LLFAVAGADTGTELIERLRSRTGEPDSLTSNYTQAEALQWINDGQAKINLLGGYTHKSTDITYAQSDSLGAVLPSDFRYQDGCMLRMGRVWEPMYLNPKFETDDSKIHYFIEWQNEDTARIYFRNIERNGLRIRLFYLATVAELGRTDTCQVWEDHQGFIIEEAYSYYLESLRMFEPAMVLRQQTRQDMGILQKVEE
jgi:hypothetical protein